MRILYRPKDVRADLDSIASLLTRLSKDWRKVMDRSPDQQWDGYPHSTMGGNGKNGHGDPTGTCVIHLVDGHPEGSDLSKFFGLIRQAQRTLMAADSLRAKLLPPLEDATEASQANWCESCLRLKVEGGRFHSPVRYAGARECWWCWRYLRAQGEKPPLRILRLHQQGKRIYDRDIASNR